MNVRNCGLQFTPTIQGHADLRWSICYRLQDLGLSSWCRAHQPMEVEMNHTADIIQFWQVVQRFTASSEELRAWLERCWHQPKSTNSAASRRGME